MRSQAAQRQRHLEAFLASRTDIFWLRRALVLDECGSTQDEAFAAAAGNPGLVLTAVRQTRGRGRLGREWVQRADLGLAVTFVLNAAAVDAACLPLRVACAVCEACEQATGSNVRTSDAAPVFRIKWPNDVVASREPRVHHAPYRKLAGVLIERRNGLLLVGIGLNVQQQSGDFPEALRAKAVSLAMLHDPGAEPPRQDSLLCRLIDSLDRFLRVDRREVLQQFRARDVVTGTRRVFECDRRRIEGIVESIDPIDGIVVRTDRAERVTLPAMTTTLVPED